MKRLTEKQKEIASYETERFGSECGYAFLGIEQNKGSKEYRGALFSYNNSLPDDYRRATSDLVKCPNCTAIQACWGQYGDPENEVCVCTVCKKGFKIESF